MNTDAQVAMSAFLHGQIRFDEFLHRMRHFLSVDFGPPAATIQYLRPLDAYVAIGPADLYPVLQSYLAGERDEAEVGHWAQLIDMLAEFGPPVGSTDEEADRLDPLWDVLANLGGPPQLERVTDASVRVYLAQLAELEAALARSAP